MNDTLLSVTEAADQLHVPPARVRRLLLSGRLAGAKVGSSGWVIPEAEIERACTTTIENLAPPPRHRSRLSGGALLSAAEAAERLHRHPSLVRKLLLQGRLRGQQVGDMGWVVYEREVERFAKLERPPRRPPRTGLTTVVRHRAA